MVNSINRHLDGISPVMWRANFNRGAAQLKYNAMKVFILRSDLSSLK
jgi:hypothetical protein